MVFCARQVMDVIKALRNDGGIEDTYEK